MTVVLLVVVRSGQPSVGGLIQGDNAAGLNLGGSIVGGIERNDVGERYGVDGDGPSNDAILSSKVLEKVVLNLISNKTGVIESDLVESTSGEVLVWVHATISVSLLERVELLGSNTTAS